jgi:hypothetical protein
VGQLVSSNPSLENVFPAAVVEVHISVDQESGYSNTRSDAELAARDAELAARDAIIKSILLKLSLK